MPLLETTGQDLPSYRLQRTRVDNRTSTTSFAGLHSRSIACTARYACHPGRRRRPARMTLRKGPTHTISASATLLLGSHTGRRPVRRAALSTQDGATCGEAMRGEEREHGQVTLPLSRWLVTTPLRTENPPGERSQQPVVDRCLVRLCRCSPAFEQNWNRHEGCNASINMKPT